MQNHLHTQIIFSSSLLWVLPALHLKTFLCKTVFFPSPFLHSDELCAYLLSWLWDVSALRWEKRCYSEKSVTLVLEPVALNMASASSQHESQRCVQYCCKTNKTQWGSQACPLNRSSTPADVHQALFSGWISYFYIFGINYFSSFYGNLAPVFKKLDFLSSSVSR